MPPPETPDASPARRDAARRLRRWHRATLAVLAGCAVAIAVQPSVPGATPPRPVVLAAAALAIATIVGRRLATSPARSPGARVGLGALALLTASGLGLLAVGLAVDTGDRQTAFVFTLAAALFVLRPPAQPAARSRAVREAGAGPR